MCDDLVEQRILEAYARTGDSGVVTGWAALRLHGGGFFDGLARDGRTRLPVPIAANGERLGPRPGLRVVRDTVPPDEIVEVHQIRCAQIERAVLDEVRRLDGDRDRVGTIDMACAARLTSIRRMRRYRWSRYWYRDIRTLDRILPLCDESSRSRPETDLRLVWELDAGWAHPLCNRDVLDRDGHLIGIPDLLDTKRCVTGEFAGADHREVGQHANDVERAEAFRRVGLETVEVVGRQLTDPTRIVHRLREAETRARERTQSWVLGPVGPSLDELLDRRELGGGVVVAAVE